MAIREVQASGREYLALGTELLQRARLADGEAGLWEAADIQWWWRMPRSSDSADQSFWLDAEGPVAAAVLLDWERAWECYPMLVPGESVPLEEVWDRAVERIKALGLTTVEMLGRDDDRELLELLSASGFVPDDGGSCSTWMDAGDRPEVAPLPAGFAMVDRGTAAGKPHPMRVRNGEEVEARLRECSLYDPGLDLAVETAGEVAGYALFWFDPVTRVGLVEPMRVEDGYQRRGLGRALLTEGLERLAARGAQRLKVGFETAPARGLYLGAGFHVASTSRSYRRRQRRTDMRDR